MIFTSLRRKPAYVKVRLSIFRTPLSTRLLNGHETNSRLGSIRITSILGSSSRTYLAAVAPPQPPPMTTTRCPALGAKSPLTVAAHPATPAPPSNSRPAPIADVLRNSLREAFMVMPSSTITSISTGMPRNLQGYVLPVKGLVGRLACDGLLHLSQDFVGIALEMDGRLEDRRWVLDAAAGEDQQGARARIELARALELDQGGQRRRGLGRGPDALGARQQPLRFDDLALADSASGSVRVAEDLEHLAPREGPGHPQSRGVGNRVLPERRVLGLLVPGLHDGCASLGLDGDEARLGGLDPAHGGELFIRLPDADEPGAAAGWIEEQVGRLPAELLGQLEAHRLLALESVRLFERGQIEPAD